MDLCSHWTHNFYRSHEIKFFQFVVNYFSHKQFGKFLSLSYPPWPPQMIKHLSYWLCADSSSIHGSLADFTD